MLQAQATPCVSISGLYALTPQLENTRELSLRVAAALDGGAAVLQYRNKTAPTASRLAQARMLRELCADRGAIFIVNDVVDLAASSVADGVHLGRDDASVASARKRLGNQALIGVSCYDSLERAEAAVRAGADYIAFGSFFPSSVKPRAPRAQLSLLSSASERWRVPIVAIGGITPANAGPLLDAGADAIAVISALFDTSDRARIESTARAFAALFASRSGLST